MEQEPKKFSREVRKGNPMLFEFIPNWEDAITSENLAASAFQSFQRELKKYGVNLTKNVKVLEIGSGNAKFLKYIKKQGVDIIGLDARPRGDYRSSQVSARVEQLPFSDGAFDVVLANNLVFDNLAYEQDQELMMEEINRVLKTKGIFLGTVFINREVLKKFNIFSSTSNNPFLKIYKKS